MYEALESSNRYIGCVEEMYGCSAFASAGVYLVEHGRANLKLKRARWGPKSGAAERPQN